MGKKNKVGKDRRDKFYKLAKETGYRSRAAFKLIQLNRRFGFLQQSQVCIDLCAAPGGWMQVAKQNMPVSSIVIGVDLFPIKNVPGCIGLIGDITTDKTKSDLTKELKTWKADIVLNDGAPNVGRNWLFDAYQQICLTLSAVKLATNFLRPGGWFVTKVFRSKDYNALIWVLKQLFKKVHATKPSASRKESAEIFVVCQYYKAPDKIDPKFLDPKYVFEELEIEPQIKINLLKDPSKTKKAKTEGYEGVDVRKIIPVSEFIANENPLNSLAVITEIKFDDKTIANHPRTTDEIKECCKDIKVLGRKDLRDLLKWQKLLYDEIHKKPEEAVVEEEAAPKTAEEVDDEEMSQIDKHIANMRKEDEKEHKRKRKKTNKERTKLNERLSLKMVIKGDEGPREEGDTIFSLKDITSKREMSQLLEQEQPPDILLGKEDSDEERLPNQKYVKYDKESKGDLYEDYNLLAKGDELDSDADLDAEGLGIGEEDDEDIDEDDGELKTKNPLITDLDYRDKDEKRRQKAQLWFEKDAFKNMQNEEEVAENYDLDKLTEKYKQEGVKVIGEDRDKLHSEKVEQELGKKARRRAKHKEGNVSSDSSDSDDDDDETAKKGKVDAEPRVKKVKLNEEELALGQMLITSKKMRRDLTDAAWNRYTFDDTNLPDWFVKDENKNMKREAPVPHEIVDSYKKNVTELNVRSIKKVMEAKTRKKKHATKRLDKIKKKAENIMENVDNTNQERIRMLKRLYKKSDPKKKEITYVVARKAGSGGKKVRRPKGVEGRFKVVDPRMKKDKRAEVAIAKKAKKSGKGKGKGGKGGNSGKPNKGKKGKKK